MTFFALVYYFIAKLCILSCLPALRNIITLRAKLMTFSDFFLYFFTFFWGMRRDQILWRIVWEQFKDNLTHSSSRDAESRKSTCAFGWIESDHVICIWGISWTLTLELTLTLTLLLTVTGTKFLKENKTGQKWHRNIGQHRVIFPGWFLEKGWGL